MKRAYRTTCWGIVSIVAAESRGKAIARTLRAIGDAGYNTAGLWGRIRAVRASEFDEWAEVDRSGDLYHEADLPKSLEGGVEHHDIRA